MTDQFRDPGEVPVLDWIDKGLIEVDPAYQRQLDEARVEKLLTWFTWASFGAIVVAPAADGRYHCTDGQHRLEAAKRHPMISMEPVAFIHRDGGAYFTEYGARWLREELAQADGQQLPGVPGVALYSRPDQPR